LLSLLGIPFEVRPAEVAEEFGDGARPEIVARRLAREKAEAARLADGTAPILAADTVVALDGAMLGKPADGDEARRMLEALRGRTHGVITAVAVLPHGERGALIRHPATSVTMRAYSDAEIAASIARGDPFDKAGAYAIQDGIFRPVESYEGCYCNVVGLPLWSTIELLQKAGLPVSVDAGDLLPQCGACPLRPPGP
jgi:MAF protein